MKQTYLYLDKSFPLDLTALGKDYRATLGEKTVNVELVRAENGRLDLLIDDKRISATVTVDGQKSWVTLNGQTLVLNKSAGTRRGAAHSAHPAGKLTSPMPGQVRAVQAAEGDTVHKGQTLVIVEAMKMEIKVAAPRDGVVKTVMVRTGQTVEREQILVELGD